ncbi:hypothetical protein ACRRTK_012788 [Alexandromys fortis]
MESHLYIQHRGAFFFFLEKKRALWEASTKGQPLPVGQTDIQNKRKSSVY